MKKYLSFFLVASGIFFSCTENKNISPARQGIKATGTVISDSNATPEIVPLTAENEPKAIAVGKIKTKPYSFSTDSGRLNITYLDAADGIPEAENSSILQDRTGNLWLGNEIGLVKYDGNEIVLFPNHNVSGLYNPGFIMTLQEDQQGNILSYGSGLGIYDGIKLSPVKAIDSIRKGDNFMASMLQDKVGDLWLLIPRKGVARFNGKDTRLYDEKDGLSNLDVDDIAMDNIGNIYITNTNAGVLKFDGNRFTSFIKQEELPKDFLTTAMQFDKSGNVWLGSFKYGLVKYDRQKKITQYTIKNGLAGNKIVRIFKDSSGVLWIPHGVGGITRIDEGGFKTFTSADGILSFPNNYGGIAPGRMGITWVAGEGTVNRLDNNFISFENIFNGVGAEKEFVNGINGIIRSRNGNYWICHWGLGVIHYDGKTMTGYSTVSGLAGNMVHRVVEDRNGNTWFATDQGLSKFDGHSFINYSSANGLKRNWVSQLMEDHSGNIWFNAGNAGNAFSKFDGHSFTHYKPFPGANRNPIQYIFEDRKGNMWFGSSGYGVCRFDGKSFTNYTIADGLADSSVSAIAEDDYGNMWFGTNKGLNRFDGNIMYRYTMDDGLSTNKINKIKKDTVNHEYWLQTSNGLTRLSITANHPDSISFLNFDKRSGFPIGPGFSFVDRDGKIWHDGGGDKLTCFDYPGLKKQMVPFNLHIKNISINNEKICWSNLLPVNEIDSILLKTEMQLKYGRPLSNDNLKKMMERYRSVHFDSLIPFDYIPQNLVLPYTANSISFDFAAIDPYFSKFTRYQFMLEGFDKMWSPLSKNTNANFGNLREGSYTFKVKALNPYGKWSKLTYSFNVQPPWYRTWWAYAIYALMFLGALRTFSKWRERRLRNEKEQLQRKVEERTAELRKKSEELENSLESLKSTQAQLIQSEKMASLGELTAGIAHEIQNPLNFVNNFSEVNGELISELVDEVDRGNTEEVKAIAGDIKQNLDKIHHHGKRADAIVKGMLAHSRQSTGQKELTDLNALAEEYLRLAYHGIKAKDKSFNAAYLFEPDPLLSRVEVIPQDIGRVLLNLINNAFQAVNGFGDNPTVRVETLKRENFIEIKVTDNGPGIPAAIRDKIFQPFFTTKPTGQGTGLGLSLSYDIVKAHGGELKVETKEGEGTVFIILLNETS